jgi:hypothetical protein
MTHKKSIARRRLAVIQTGQNRILSEKRFLGRVDSDIRTVQDTLRRAREILQLVSFLEKRYLVNPGTDREVVAMHIATRREEGVWYAWREIHKLLKELDG